jgi:hypothetical protein
LDAEVEASDAVTLVDAVDDEEAAAAFLPVAFPLARDVVDFLAAVLVFFVV